MNASNSDDLDDLYSSFDESKYVVNCLGPSRSSEYVPELGLKAVEAHAFANMSYNCTQQFRDDW